MTFFDILRSALFGIHLPTEPGNKSLEIAFEKYMIEEIEKTPTPKKPRKSKVKVEGNANLLYTKEELKNIKEPE